MWVEINSTTEIWEWISNSMQNFIGHVITYAFGLKLNHVNNRALWYIHGDVIKWEHFPRYWPFVRGIHRSLVNSSYKGQWCGALMFSFICGCINGWVNNRKAGDLKRRCTHYDVTVMLKVGCVKWDRYAIYYLDYLAKCNNLAKPLPLLFEKNASLIVQLIKSSCTIQDFQLFELLVDNEQYLHKQDE